MLYDSFIQSFICTSCLDVFSNNEYNKQNKSRVQIKQPSNSHIINYYIVLNYLLNYAGLGKKNE